MTKQKIFNSVFALMIFGICSFALNGQAGGDNPFTAPSELVFDEYSTGPAGPAGIQPGSTKRMAKVRTSPAPQKTTKQNFTDGMKKLSEILDTKETDEGFMSTFDSEMLFKTGSSELSQRAANEIQKIVNILKNNPNTSVTVLGHTDDQGPETFNQDLSEKRATAVREKMVELGLNNQKIKAKGFGEARPITSNDSPEGRLKNRRVELLFQIPQEK